MPQISQRGTLMPASPIRKLVPLADDAKARGIHVYHLNIGQPDLPTPQAAIDAIRSIDRKVLEYSPSQGYLSYRTKLVDYYKKYDINLTADDIIVTTGGSEAGLFSFMACLNPGDEIIMPDPFYANYQAFAISAGAVIRTIPTTIEEGFCLPKVERFEELINERTKAIMICNPNNPTGQLTNRELLLEILNKCVEVNAKLLIDECFMDFVDEAKAFSMRALLEQYPNLIILKAFTKTFAIPGVRLGYCLNSNQELHKSLHQCGQDWSVSILAQEAGKVALLEKEYLEKSFELIQRERKYLIRHLKCLGAKIYGSEANYIFFKMKQPKNLVEVLKEQGYLIRSCANYHNLGEDYYRIAVKVRCFNYGLIKAIMEEKKDAFFTNDY